MSNEKPMVSAYPPRPLAEPRSGCYAGCERAASEVFGCIPHGRGAYRESDSFAMWAGLHGVTVSMTTVSILDPFIPTYGLDEFVKVSAAGYGDVNVFAMV